MSIEFSIINFESPYYSKVLALRNKVLRVPIGLNLYDEDLSDDKNQYIIIGLQGEEVIACLMLSIIDAKTIKFRQMAVDTEAQMSGLGSLLMHYAENFCVLNEYSLIELHARISAEGFYKKLAFQSTGDIFQEVGIPHIKMTKEIVKL